MYKNIKVEAEHDELILENDFGDKVIIPADKRDWVKQKLNERCYGCIDGLVDSLPAMEDYADDGAVYKNMKVHELYTAKTGKEWNTAKQEGLTTGTYEDNMSLRDRLLSGELDDPNAMNLPPLEERSIKDSKTFNEAFRTARNQLGANQIFEWQGRKYGTNLRGEEFNPSDEILTQFNINTPEVKERLKQQNMLVKSPYSTQDVAKLEDSPDITQEAIAARGQDLNKITQADTISNYYKGTNENYAIMDNNQGILQQYEGENLINSYDMSDGIISIDIPGITDLGEVIPVLNPTQSDLIRRYHKGTDKEYAIVDKKTGTLNYYRGDEIIKTMRVGVGANEGDDETVTVVDSETEKVLWHLGNKMTGAGIYTVNWMDPTKSNYEDAPFWTFVNDKGEKQRMAFHAAFTKKRVKALQDDDLNDPETLKNNRMSYGCINGLCHDLHDLYEKGFDVGDNLYVLPESGGGVFEIKDNQLIFNREKQQQ